MADQVTGVYQDPGVPGAPQVGDVVYQDHTVADAPQVGDVVVVVWDGDPMDPDDRGEQRYQGLVVRLVEVWVPTGCVVPYPWYVELPVWQGYRRHAVHAIRRPTEAELAAWALTQDPVC